MIKRDVEYRNKVLRRQVVKQSKTLRRLLYLRLNRSLRQTIKNLDTVDELDIITIISNALNDSEREVFRIRKKNDLTKKYGINVLRELQRLKNKYGSKKK